MGSRVVVSSADAGRVQAVRIAAVEAARAAMSRVSHLHEVLPGLFLGSLRNARDAELLKSYQIGDVLSIHDNPRAVHQGLRYCLLECSDTMDQDLGPLRNEAFAFIHNARRQNRRVLVHCVMGMSRSASVVCGYVACVAGLSVVDALRLLRVRRPSVAPNDAFLRQLRQWEQEGSLASALVSLGPLAAAAAAADARSCAEALAEAARREARADAHHRCSSDT